MRCHSFTNLRNAAFVALILTGSFLGLASFARADKTSAELRVDTLSAAMRWSLLNVPDPSYGHADGSLYLSPGLGIRVFPKQPHHGLLVDAQYRWDVDVDSAFDEGAQWNTDFPVWGCAWPQAAVAQALADHGERAS